MDDWWAASLFSVRVLDGNDIYFFIAVGRVLLQRFRKRGPYIVGAVKFGTTVFITAHNLKLCAIGGHCTVATKSSDSFFSASPKRKKC